MTSISGPQSYQTYTAQRPPPPSGKDRLTAAIGNEVSTGALSQTDATALASALDSIDQSLASDRGSAQSSGGTKRLDPSQMKDRIDSLISDQVSSGTLTGDQADTLKELFAQQGGRGGPEGGEMGGPGGPPPGPPPSGGMRDGTDAASGSTSASSTASDLLASFIEQLQAAQSSNARYAASGQSSSQQSAALLFDFTT